METGGTSPTEVSLSAATMTAPAVCRTFLRFMPGTWCSAGLTLLCAGDEVIGPDIDGSVFGFVEFILGQAVSGRVIAIVVHI